MAIPAQAIPQRMLSDAEGIAIIPKVIKGGFVIGARHGRGTLLVRDENKAWQKYSRKQAVSQLFGEGA